MGLGEGAERVGGDLDGHGWSTTRAWVEKGPERVSLPAATERPELWRRAVDVIRREPPDYIPCFLHRDFHPGNVLFEGNGDDLRISGVVDWVETSWGPADLDVAHSSTALALLHGVPTGMSFADRYVAAGGTLAEDRAAHLYWRLLDALAFAPVRPIRLSSPRPAGAPYFAGSLAMPRAPIGTCRLG